MIIYQCIHYYSLIAISLLCYVQANKRLEDIRTRSMLDEIRSKTQDIRSKVQQQNQNQNQNHHHSAYTYTSTKQAKKKQKQQQQFQQKKHVSQLRVGVTYRPSKNCLRESKHGDYLIIHYNATIYPFDNKTVDSSYERESPFRFHLGSNQVIPGLEKGLFRMCIGEHRKLVIPPKFAYGNVGATHMIPPDSTLIYRVELLDLIDGNSTEGKRIGMEMWYEDISF